MPRETVFEETQTWATKTDGGGDEPDFVFHGATLATANPEPGQSYNLDVKVEAATKNAFYLVVTRDKGTDTEEQLHDLGYLNLDNEVYEVSMSLDVPEGADEVSVTVEGGYEA